MTTKQAKRFGFALKLAFCLVAAGLGTALVGPSAAAAPAIVTQSGSLKGIESNDLNRYLGIPYAVPPVGPLRWTPPQPFGRWNGVFQATQFGNFCTQPGLGSEDCLYLNVYTQAQKKNRHKHHGMPVMVWIHGGSLVTGGGGFYDPTRMIEQSGVIVVTINYRVGLFGFFAHPAIDAEGHRNGNYGLMDQQLALQWVKRNINAFGGDPNRMTIFGESAGGQSVYANMASPTAAGLFQRAISESGSYSEFQPYFEGVYIVSLLQAESVGTPLVSSGIDLATAAGCTTLPQTAACLRGIPAATLVAIGPSVLYPFVDGTILTQTPGAAFASGQFNQVPVISGGNHDEYRLFVAEDFDAKGTPLTNAGYAAATAVVLDGFAPFVLPEYPLSASPPADAASLTLGESGTDGIFACSERNGVQLLSKYVTTYAYELNDENAYLIFDEFPGITLSFPLGAPHFSEVPYLFDVFGTSSDFSQPGQESLSEAMISYWTHFAATGDPNSPATSTWTPYDSTTDQFQSFVPPTPVVEPGGSFDSDHRCSTFWNLL